jgi:uncharacterized membrane protein
MSMTASKTALSLAAVAAVMALSNFTASSTAFAQEAKDAKVVHCYGVNSCKGMSDCKSGKHDCKGMNDCKGQGFKELSAKACTSQGGSLTAPKG